LITATFAIATGVKKATSKSSNLKTLMN
jgi:hypothetical protein